MKKQIFVLILSLCLFSETALNAQKMAVSPVIGVESTKEIIGGTVDNDAFVSIAPRMSDYTLGVQGRYEFSDKFSAHLLAEGTFGNGHLSSRMQPPAFRRVDIHIEPQFEYKPIKYLGIYLGLQKKFNIDEWSTDSTDSWFSRKSFVGIDGKNLDLRSFKSYELRGKIGLRGYWKNAFLDLSYFHGISPTTEVQYTDDMGNNSELKPFYAEGMRVAIGYFFK